MTTLVRPAPEHGKRAALRRAIDFLAIFAAAVLVFPAGLAQEDAAAKMSFDLPADDAERSLKRFSARSGLEVLFVSASVANVRTKEVKGDYTPREAIDRMLAGTKLAALQEEKNGAMRIVSAAGANGRNGSADSPPGTQALAKKKPE
ncbi:MAG: STN domain-containing protein, partial [Opitutaceae bacterium]